MAWRRERRVFRTLSLAAIRRESVAVRGQIFFRRHVTGASNPRTELALATAGMASTNFATLGIAALIPFIRRDIPMTEADVGAVASCSALAAAVCILLTTRIVERVGAGIAVAIAEGVVVAATVLCLVARSFPTLLGAMAALGVAYGVLNPATNLLATGTVGARKRGLAMGIKQTGVTVGGALAGVSLPAVASTASWRWSLVLPLTAAVLVGIWAASARVPGSGRAPVLGETVRAGRLQIAIYGFAMAGIQTAILGYLTLYLVGNNHWTPSVAGDGFAATLVAAAIGRVAWGAVSDRIKHRQRLLIGLGTCATLSLALIPIVTAPVLWVLLIAVGMSAAGWNGVFQVVVAESADERGVARASGYALFFVYAGSVGVPPMLGSLVSAVAWPVFWEVAASLAAAGTAVWALAHYEEVGIRASATCN